LILFIIFNIPLFLFVKFNHCCVTRFYHRLLHEKKRKTSQTRRDLSNESSVISYIIKKLLRATAEYSYLRPIKQYRIKFSRFQLKTCCRVVKYFRMSYRPSVETSHSSIVSLHPTRVSVYRFPLSVYRGLFPAFRVYLQQPRRPDRVEESRHDRRSRPKSLDEVRAVARMLNSI